MQIRKRKCSLPPLFEADDQPVQSRLRLETPDSVLIGSDTILPCLSVGLAPDCHCEEHISNTLAPHRRDLRKVITTSMGHAINEIDLALYRVWNQNRLPKQKECMREIIVLADKFAKDLKTSLNSSV